MINYIPLWIYTKMNFRAVHEPLDQLLETIAVESTWLKPNDRVQPVRTGVDFAHR